MFKNNRIITSAVRSGLIAFITYIYRHEIREISIVAFNEIKKYIGDHMYVQLTINRKTEPRLTFSLSEEMLKTYSSSFQARDGNVQPNYAISDKTYIVTHDDQKICIVFTEDRVELYTFMGEIDVLKDYVETIYKKYCSPDNMIMYYSVDTNDNKWNVPFFRLPRNYNQTDNINHVLSIVDKFVGSEKEYSRSGKNYKLGMLLLGKPGIGKSTMIEVIAKKHSMPIYILNLNSDGMNDTTLLNLTSSVPPKSIICLEEIEKQLDAIKNRKTISVTPAGILSAIDGVPRLNHGVIFIATGNSIDGIDKSLGEPLLREGRLDNVITFS